MKYKIIIDTDEEDEIKFRTACNTSLKYGLLNAGVKTTILEIVVEGGLLDRGRAEMLLFPANLIGPDTAQTD